MLCSPVSPIILRQASPTLKGVSLSVYSYLYSDLKVNVGCEAAGVLIRVHKAEGAPLAVSDEFVVRTRLTSTSLDVLANDDPGNAGSRCN
jgi:hypothetical protein